MDLIILILGIALIGFAVWAVTTYIPMAPPFQVAIYILCVIVLVLWILNRFGGSVHTVLP